VYDLHLMAFQDFEKMVTFTFAIVVGCCFAVPWWMYTVRFRPGYLSLEQLDAAMKG
jgi:hypothetical protein